MTFYVEAANKLADGWGPALTKMIQEKTVEPLMALCEPRVELTVQTSEGGTAVFTIGNEGCTISWEEFLELQAADLEEQNYKESESACVGILGNRCILEAARINKDDEPYANAFSLVTLSPNGKISKFENFADSLAPSVIDVALAKEVADAVNLQM